MSFASVIAWNHNKMWVDCETIEIDSCGKKVKVRLLSELEAKALISQEYGFELNSIKIIGQCWYEATDWNYFEFMVKGWKYRVKNFGALELIE